MNTRQILLALLAMTFVLGSQRSNAALLMDFNLSDCGDFLGSIGDYYAGGSDCAGVQGPNLGVEFTSSSLFHTDDLSVLVFESDIFIPAARLEVAAGFSDGIAFRLSAFDIGLPFFVRIGNDDGVLLSERISMVPIDPDAQWATVGLAFEGTATWLRFFTEGEIPISIDDLTLGSTTIVPIPAAGWLLLSGCLGLFGGRLVRKT